MLFKFITYLKFRKNGRTEEWQAAYDCLCNKTDYLYLRKVELKSCRGTIISASAFALAIGFMLLNPLFRTWSTYLIATLFFLVFALYIFSVYSYIPMEIIPATIYSKEKCRRNPSSVKRRKIKDAELIHEYYIYRSEDGKSGIDMNDRILGVDSNYKEDQPVLVFTGPNGYYFLSIKEV